MQVNNSSRYVFIGILCLAIGGCATPKTRKSTVPQVPPPLVEQQVTTAPLEIGRPARPQPLPQAEPVAPEQQPAPIQKELPVVVALLQDVDQLQQQGNFDQAAARVERGLRIAPKDARLWQRLAIIRLQQERPQQAENMAKKSNSLARGDYQMQATNWRIIAESRARRGDMVGAERAKDRAAKYQ